MTLAPRMRVSHDIFRGTQFHPARPAVCTGSTMAHAVHPIYATPAAEALLAANALPVSDLRGDPPVVLFGAGADDRLDGVVGLELHGTVALLRSLAVDADARRGGLGMALVAHAEQQAAAHGAQAVYLLTTTAAAFFARLGYRDADRGHAPAAIAATRQFSGLCPASSAFMVKHLLRDAPG